MNKGTKRNSLLLSGPIGRGIVLFAIPIFIGNLFQQLYNVVDSLVVGNYLSNEALAAVSSSNALIQLLIGFFEGFNIGAGVVIARYFGKKDVLNMQKSIHTSVGLSFVLGLGLTVFGTLLVPFLLKLMDTPPDVLPESITYFRIYFMGSVFFAMYNCFANIFRAVGDSITPIKYLIIASIIHIVLDYVFVAMWGYGVGSTALATIISQGISALLCLISLMKTNEDYKLRISKVKIEKAYLKPILENGIPTGVQGSIISFANVVVQSNVNAFGGYAIAGNGSYEKISGFLFLPITCFSLSISTFMGQNLGAGNIERLKKGANFVIITGVVLSQLLGILIYFFIPSLMTLFSTDSRVIFFGVSKGRILSGFSFLLAFSHIVSGIIRGIGKSYIPMFIMLLCWCVIRLIYISIALKFNYSMDTISWAYPFTWSLSSIIYLVYFLRIKWEEL